MDRPSSPLAGEPFSTIRQRHCPPPCPAGSARSVPRLAKPGAAKSGAALARDWAAPGGPPAPAQDPQARWQANHFLPTDTGTARPLPGRVSPKRPPPGKARRGKERGGSGPRLGGAGRPPCPGARPAQPEPLLTLALTHAGSFFPSTIPPLPQCNTHPRRPRSIPRLRFRPPIPPASPCLLCPHPRLRRRPPAGSGPLSPPPAQA